MITASYWLLAPIGVYFLYVAVFCGLCVIYKRLKRHDQDEERLRELTDTTYDGRTIVKSDVLAGSDEFKEAVRTAADE